MISIPGYKVNDVIYQSDKTIIYRGLNINSGKIYAFKTIVNEYPAIKEIDKIHMEYDILNKLNNEQGIIQLRGYEKYQNRPVIIMDFFNGLSLQDYINSNKLSVIEFLDIAMKIINSLDIIHRKNIIHKDINLSNVMWNEKSQLINIIDFGLATHLTKENQEIVHPDTLEGTLIYISPEQTGRMNRSIDYRTDYYSLGISFYKMLTGRFPFETDDMMELVHSHIAKEPLKLTDIDDKIPQEISDIILKLIEKTPEQRYQGLTSLYNDFKYCKDQLVKNGKIKSFKIAKNDVSSKFQISEKLYGRENEISSLMRIFNSTASGNKEVVLFTGDAGIGKTAVINEINKPILEKKGYFVNAKFDAYKRNQPYLAIIEIVSKLLQQLLIESNESLDNWKNKILSVLNNKGKVIIDIIPRLESLIGQQPEVEMLPPVESQNRFNLIFKDFIKVFTALEHPLVFFIDDLQWVDNASLNLINVLLKDSELKYFLMILAYRDNEVKTGHPFYSVIEKLTNASNNVHKFKLKPLKENDIINILIDTFKCDVEKASSLAILVLEKTGGNPFFVLAFLESLYKNELIIFNNGWKWTIHEIMKAKVTDNVVELIAGKIKHLKNETLDMIKLACCIGSTVNIDTLALISKKSYQETFNILIEAINEGIFIKIKNNVKFIHDKVSEAVYSLIGEQEKQELHYQIGLILLNNSDYYDVFQITEQLNQAQNLLNAEYRKKLFNLNIEAGQKAKLSNAYLSSALFYRQAVKLMQPDLWETNYKKAINFHNDWTEAEFLANNKEELENLFNLIEKKAEKPKDMSKMICCKIEYVTNQVDLSGAIKIGLDYIKQLGETIPEVVEQDTIGKMLQRVYDKIGERDIEDLLNLQELTDEIQKIIISILSYINIPAYMSGSPLFFVLILEAIDRSIEYGNSPELAYFYSVIPILLGNVVGDYKKAYEFGKLGVKLSEKYNSSLFKGRCYHMFSWINHMGETHEKTLLILEKALQASLEAGDHQRVLYVFIYILITNIILGKNLQEIDKLINNYMPIIKRIDQLQGGAHFSIWAEFIKNLSGLSDDIFSLKGNLFDEDIMLPIFKKNNDYSGQAYNALIKTIIYYLFRQHKKAFEFSKLTQENINGILGQPLIQYYEFYYALILIKEIEDSNSTYENNELTIQLNDIINKYKNYSNLAPYNYEHKYLLLEAENAKIQGKPVNDIIELYDRSINKANINNFKHEEAIVNECAARHLFKNGWDKIAIFYIQEAYYCYELWGCNPKLEQLQKEFPGYINTSLPKDIPLVSKISSSTFQSSGLDLYSVMKAANALSGEIDLGKLLEKMIKYVIENAGAEKGFFILSADGKWFIQAEGSPDNIKVLHSIPISDENKDKLSHGIIHFVQNSHSSIVLHDAAKDGKFINDPYIKSKSPKSILCMPLINKNEIIGILYLENNLSTGAFTSDRLQVLKLLSSQMAITIENARMFKALDDLNKNLDRKVQERTKELQETIIELKQTQSQLIESEKLAALGQLTAGISHEINTPLGAIRSSIENINNVVSSTIPGLPDFLQKISDKLYDLFMDLLKSGVNKQRISAREERQIKKEIKSSMDKLNIDYNVEVVLKLLALGVHENLEYFLPVFESSMRDEILDAAHKLSTINQNTKIIQSAANKASKVTFALKNYSHFDHTGKKISTNIKENIETVLTLYQNQLKHGIEIIKNYQDMPSILCYPDELNQVWTNIIHNAIQAMDHKGTLTIDLYRRGDCICVSFKDTGEGIPDEIKEKIFNPFFTTRSSGEGSGLGLGIVKTIVDKHRGKIEVESKPGEGSVFIVILPFDLEGVACD